MKFLVKVLAGYKKELLNEKANMSNFYVNKMLCEKTFIMNERNRPIC